MALTQCLLLQAKVHFNPTKVWSPSLCHRLHIVINLPIVPIHDTNIRWTFFPVHQYSCYTFNPILNGIRDMRCNLNKGSNMWGQEYKWLNNIIDTFQQQWKNRNNFFKIIPLSLFINDRLTEKKSSQYNK